MANETSSPPNAIASPGRSLGRWALGALACAALWLVLDFLPEQRERAFAAWRTAELERGVSVVRVPEQVAHETRVLGVSVLLVLFAVVAGRAGLRRLGGNRAAADPHAAAEKARELARDVTREALETARALAPPSPPPSTESEGAPALPCEPLTQVVERLRDPWAPVRLGAIHSLRRIGEVYPDWRAAAVDVLVAYVREHAALPEAPRPTERRSLLGGGSMRREEPQGAARAGDEPTLQQALTSLGALARADLDGPLDLSGLELSGMSLEGARLEGALFRGTRVAGLALEGAHLQGADFSGAVGFDLEQLRGARVDAATRLPQSVSPPS